MSTTTQEPGSSANPPGPTTTGGTEDGTSLARLYLLSGLTIIGVVALLIGVAIFVQMTGIVSFAPTISIGDLFTGLSLIAGAIIARAEYRRAKKAAQIGHTTDLLTELSTNDSLFESLTAVYHMDGAAVAAAFKHDSLDQSQLEHIVRVFNYYNFVANSCSAGYANRDSIFTLRGEAMWQTYTNYYEFITEVRNQRDDQTVWCEFTALAEAYGRKKGKSLPAPSPSNDSLPSPI
ncbi:DUF4760 domain-containing protein [Halomarina salina]|uniref:DUF4760 domain-containing protein n=1 Tax=Halomarina salina TaxID=1872699 RepID=A0ABD5RP26_9EURY|nr:DUF4760 domain-containing protein [Halomarina salina]